MATSRPDTSSPTNTEDPDEDDWGDDDWGILSCRQVGERYGFGQTKYDYIKVYNILHLDSVKGQQVPV